MQMRIGRYLLLASTLFVGLLLLPVRSEAGFINTLQLEPEHKTSGEFRTEMVVENSPAQQGTPSMPKQRKSLNNSENDATKKPAA